MKHPIKSGSVKQKEVKNNCTPQIRSIEWGKKIVFKEHKLRRILAVVERLAMQRMREQFQRDRIVESEERQVRHQ